MPTQKRRRLIVILTCVFAVFVVAFVMCAQASVTPWKTNATSGKCLSVSFDKPKMQTVNRIEITEGEKHIEIADPALISSMVQETMVATHIGTGCDYERKIELYCDDTLIRTMYWSTCCDSVCVYDADAAHWVFSTEGTRPKGYIFLSESLVASLNQLIA